MSQTPTRSDLPDSEHRGLPMVVAQPDEPQEGWLTRVMRILFGWKAAATRADLEHVLTAEQPQSGFSPEEAAMLKNILGLRECRIESVMVPRADIVAVQQDIAIGELVRVFEVAAHSRLVVYNDTLDDPTGMIHIRDLIAFMAARASTSSVVAPASPINRTRPISTSPMSIWRCRCRRRRSFAKSSTRRHPCRCSICSPRCRQPASTWR